MLLPICFKDYIYTHHDYLKEILTPSDYHSIEFIDVNKLLSTKLVAPRKALLKLCRSYFTQENINEKDKIEILEEVPHKWEIHGDLVLFPRESLKNLFWEMRNEEFWRSVATGK